MRQVEGCDWDELCKKVGKLGMGMRLCVWECMSWIRTHGVGLDVMVRGFAFGQFGERVRKRM
jgi:hypothetical protein